MMAARQIISYDDISLPYDERASGPPANQNFRQPPAKKRRKNNQKSKHDFQRNAPMSRNYGTNTAPAVASSSGPSMGNSAAADEEGYHEGEYEEESRELTHNEIWDDSALVDAWEAAQQEYEMYHGKSKDWQNEPIKKSPLWYNVPPDPSSKPQENSAQKTILSSDPSHLPHAGAQDGNAEPDSQPINFDTFVPTHDPSLPVPPVVNGNAQGFIPDTPAGQMVSQDEAFSRAMSAMYWGGYWTAMYHCQRQLSKQHDAQKGLDEETSEEIEEDNDDDTEDVSGFVSTQR